jgi:hypothetical protein
MPIYKRRIASPGSINALQQRYPLQHLVHNYNIDEKASQTRRFDSHAASGGNIPGESTGLANEWGIIAVRIPVGYP